MHKHIVMWLTCVIGCFSTHNGIPYSQAAQRFMHAASEYSHDGEWMKGLSLHQKMPNNTFPVFTQRDILDMAIHDIGPSRARLPSCFRIPSLIRINETTLVAFAEARSPTCADCSTTGIVYKRSTDAGMSWSQIKYVVPPTDVGANPTTVYDRTTKRIYLYYVRGMSKDPVTNQSICIKGQSNHYIVSADEGRTWSNSVDMTAMMGSFKGALPGPGNSVQQRNGRLIIPFHYGTAERFWGRDLVVWSDDGQEYHVAETAIPKMDEATVAAIPSPSLSHDTLVLWMRNAHNNQSCACKTRSVSTDNGITWSQIYNEPQLLDPICQGSATVFNNSLFYVGPRFKYARSRLTLWHKPATLYNDSTQWSMTNVTDASVYADYSTLTNGLMQNPGDRKGTHIGVLWSGCILPYPFRVWCIRYWQIVYTQIDWPMKPDG